MSKKTVEAKAKGVFFQALGIGVGVAVIVPLINMGLTKLGVKLA